MVSVIAGVALGFSMAESESLSGCRLLPVLGFELVELAELVVRKNPFFQVLPALGGFTLSSWADSCVARWKDQGLS